MLEKYDGMSLVILASSQWKCVRIVLGSGQKKGEWLPGIFCAKLCHLELKADLLMPRVCQSLSQTVPLTYTEFPQVSKEFHQFKTFNSLTIVLKYNTKGYKRKNPIPTVALICSSYLWPKITK